jgi:hypothetical protein
MQVWAGTGEPNSRNSISPGGGVYKSTDGGLTWRPMEEAAHDALFEEDPLTNTARALSAHLVELPLAVLYDLCLAPAVRIVASGQELSPSQIDILIESCWRAVARST